MHSKIIAVKEVTSTFAVPFKFGVTSQETASQTATIFNAIHRVPFNVSRK